MSRFWRIINTNDQLIKQNWSIIKRKRYHHAIHRMDEMIVDAFIISFLEHIRHHLFRRE